MNKILSLILAAVFALLGLLTGGWLSVQLVRAADAQSFPALAVEIMLLTPVNSPLVPSRTSPIGSGWNGPLGAIS